MHITGLDMCIYLSVNQLNDVNYVGYTKHLYKHTYTHTHTHIYIYIYISAPEPSYDIIKIYIPSTTCGVLFGYCN